MTTVMHMFLIYLSIYFCLTCFGLFLAHLQRQVYNLDSGSSLLGMVPALVADTIRWKLEPLPNLYTCL
jgi:hypothetical protein